MQGIIAAVPTPINGQGQPLKGPFLRHARWALENGCDGLNILGSTGEANNFDSEARKDVMRWAAEGLDVSRLMVGTGTPALAETIRLTEHADDLGYPVALVLPPYYYKSISDDGLFDWYTALHAALATRPIRIYFYNYPQMTGIVISPALIERLHRAFPERFCGIKDSSGDLPYCREIAAALPDFRVFPSSETSLDETEGSGFAGVISATVNLSAPLCGQLWTGRIAPEPALLAQVGAIRASVAGPTLVPAVKYLCGKRFGEDWSNVLPPFRALDDATKAALDAALAPANRVAE